MKFLNHDASSKEFKHKSIKCNIDKNKKGKF